MTIKKIFSYSMLVAFLFISTIASWNCSNPKHDGVLNQNIRPKTRLSNVPPLDDTIKTPNPRLSLNWVGDDPDGFVVGYKYSWSYKENGVEKIHPYKIILNLIVEKFALMILTENEKDVPAVYRYFATLDPSVGLEQNKKDSLSRGDTISVLGVKVFASNSDSIRILSGERIKYSFPIHTNPNSGTFIFDSQDQWNFHTFQVSAIDNIGEASLIPAMVSFETPQVVPPHTKVTEFPADTAFVINGFTATYTGLLFRFQGIDPNSRTIEYRWVVDKDGWRAQNKEIPWSKFSPSEVAHVTAADFPNPYETKHTLYVQSKNEFGSIDTVGYYENIITDQNHDSIGVQVDTAWQTFYTIYPPFRITPNRKVLFLNNSFYSSRFVLSPTHPYWSTVDDYYRNIANGIGIPDSDITMWRVGKYSFPGRAEIAKYNSVIMYSDCVDEFYTWGQDLQFVVAKQNVIRDYCYIGGNVIFSGWAVTAGINTPRTDVFYRNILHVNSTKGRRFPDADGIGANGLRGYPNLRLDTTKVDTAWHGGLTAMMMNYPVGFGETIQKYASKSGNPYMEDIPISLRYNGVTFNMILFGVPLYYMERPAVDSALAMAFRDIEK